MDKAGGFRSAGLAARLVFGLGLALASFPTQADSLAAQAPGTGDKGMDMVLDLLVLRPLGLVTTGIGSVLFVVSLPFTVPSGSVGAAACELVSEPLAYTFTRPLGDIENPDGNCRDGAKR